MPWILQPRMSQVLKRNNCKRTATWGGLIFSTSDLLVRMSL